MAEPTTRIVECDVLIVGGGMSGCGAAIEARYWAGDDLRIVMVDKAATDRSGAVGEGLSAINMYMGGRWGWNQPEDYVEYVRNDMMGVSREDLVYDIARHVDSSVHMFEEWGLPFWYDDNEQYVREGRWQVMIHGEAYKPIVSEATKKALGPDNHYERVFISHLFTDADDPNRIAGAVGFGVREDVIYVFKANAVVCGAGGATALFRPRSVGEGMGRTWYSIFDTGSVYGLIIPIGGEMTQMEHRFVPQPVQGFLRPGWRVVATVPCRPHQRRRRKTTSSTACPNSKNTIPMVPPSRHLPRFVTTCSGPKSRPATAPSSSKPPKPSRRWLPATRCDGGKLSGKPGKTSWT